MKRDQDGRVAVTETEFRANPGPAIDQAMSGTGVHVTDAAGELSMSIYSLDGSGEERERLRDAVIEAANQLDEAYSAIWSGSETATVGQVRDNLHYAIGCVMKAARELDAHERKAGG